MRHGVTLVELLIVITLAALLGVITLPRLAGPLATLKAEQEALHIAAAHTRARMIAVTSSRVALLDIAPDSITIRTVARNDTTLRWRGPGPAMSGVGLSGPARTVLFSPIGITYGVSNGTWTVSYRGAVRRVIVSRLGRVRIERP
ncbi:MAG TPA: prepilin-type N-terminal cleavage/methylation domain-containing protein [Gemmatimonadales bacterium]|nr:prepilin-type N-terminal cleavage/methylation domain-containing protein [Gemmatimonadales bacterium]